MANDCFEKLKERFKNIDPEHLERLIHNLEQVKGSKDYNRAAKLIRSATLGEAKMATHQRVMDALADVENSRFISREEFDGNVSDALIAKASGVDYAVEGGNFNFSQVRKSFLGKYVNLVRQAFGDSVELLHDAKSELHIRKAIEALNKGESISNFHKSIQDAASNIRAINKALVRELRELGYPIQERNDFIVRQTHNRAKITESGFQEWSNTIRPLLNQEMTFGYGKSEEEITGVLRGVYEQINNEGEIGVGNFGGQRSLHFQDAEAGWQYNQKFGNGDMIDTLTMTLNSASRVAASMQVFGTSNGRDAWRKMVKAAETKIKESGDAKQIAKWDRTKFQWEGFEREMFGSNQHPGLNIYGKTAKFLSLVQSSALLGKAVISSATDIAFSNVSFQVNTGKSNWGSMFGTLDSFFKVMKKEDFDTWARAMDMDFSELLGDTFDRFGVNMGGGNSFAAERYFKWANKLTGLDYQYSRAQVGNARRYAIELGQNVMKGYDQLDPRLQNSLKRFNITGKEWDKLRSEGVADLNGVKAVLPEALEDNALRSKLAVALSDMAQVGSPASSARERVIANLGTDPNTPAGAALRVMMQFKSFALAVPRVYRRIALNNPQSDARTWRQAMRDTGDLAYFASAMTQATLIAAGGIYVKNMLAGRKTEIMDKDGNIDPKFIMEAVAAGAIPMMATYVLDSFRGEYKKYGRSIVKDILGPTFGQLDEASQIIGEVGKALDGYYQGKHNVNSKVMQKTIRLMLRNTPGQNLPFVKPALEAAFLNDLYDFLNPGYMRRVEKRQRENKDIFNPFAR